MLKRYRRIENYFYVILSIACLAIIIYTLSKNYRVHKNESTIFTNSIPVDCRTKDLYFSREREALTVYYDSLPSGNIYLFEFTIHNPSYEPLIITDISSSCSCTGYLINKKILDSGDTTGMKVFFNSKHKEGNQTLGLWFTIQGDTIPQRLYLTGYIQPKLH